MGSRDVSHVHVIPEHSSAFGFLVRVTLRHLFHAVLPTPTLVVIFAHERPDDVQRENGHGVESPVFRSGLINHFFRIGFSHRIGDVSVFRDFSLRPITLVTLNIISAPVFFCEDIPFRSRVAYCCKGAGEYKASYCLGVDNGLKDMVIFGKASVVDFLGSLSIVSNGGASMNDRGASLKGLVIAASVKEVGFKKDYLPGTLLV